jgi:hypothetical protein
MRASPAFQISLHHFGVWRFAIYSLAILSGMIFGVWLCLHEALPQSLTLGVALLVAGLMWLGVRTLLHNRPLGLRWDGQAWYLGELPAAVELWAPGRMQVTLDLGFWMLLRFTPSVWAPNSISRWLPVQRLGIETHWHGLRCSLYSPIEPSP